MDASTSPVIVAIIRKARAGGEAKFEAALHEFIQRSLGEPGQLGVHVLRPAPGSDSREYGILRRFANAAARDAFYSSAVFRDWQQKVAPLTEGDPRYERVERTRNVVHAARPARDGSAAPLEDGRRDVFAAFTP